MDKEKSGTLHEFKKLANMPCEGKIATKVKKKKKGEEDIEEGKSREEGISHRKREN